MNWFLPDADELLFLLQEKDWSVLKSVLGSLPVLLQNKTIILSAQKHLIDSLCSNLCAMVGVGMCWLSCDQ